MRWLLRKLITGFVTSGVFVASSYGNFLATATEQNPTAGERVVKNSRSAENGDEAGVGSEIPPLEKSKLIEEPFVSPAVVATQCRLPEKVSFSLRQGETELLELRFKKCDLVVEDNGVVSISVGIQAAFNLNADVSHCSSFQLALLFETKQGGNDLQWMGNRTLVNNLHVENLEGDQKNLGYFVLHNKPSSTPTTIGQILSPQITSPSYSDLYWGTAFVLQEDGSGALSREIRKKTPVTHRKSLNGPDTPDLLVAVDLELYTSRGWCIYKEEESASDKIVVLSVIEK